MNRVRVQIAADRLTAEVQIGPGAPTEAAELPTALAAAGVVHGIDASVIARLGPLLADRHCAERAVVAHATAPTPGHNGTVSYSFAAAPLSGHRRDDDAIDYRERAFLHPAATGAEIARIHPPMPGRDGRDVLGRVLPAPAVTAASLRLGQGAELRADGAVVARCDGVVTTPNGGIDVLPLYQHQGDVDLHSGNLHSHGSVLVTGDLHAGFQIEADGDVAVLGSTFGGAVHAGGSVTIGLGAQAGSRVAAAGELRCRHATSSTLTAAGTLQVADELVHCQAAAARIELLDGRGRALGGALRARDAVAVLTAGSSSGASTLLAAADLTSAAGELVRRQRQVDRVERQGLKVGGRDQGPARGGKLGRQRTSAVDAAQAERLELARQQRELLRTAHVIVRDRAHVGVRIQLGQTTKALTGDCAGARFRWDEATGTIVQEAP